MATSKRAHESSVSTWLQRYRDGDSDAARRIWSRYIERALQLARRRMGTSRRTDADEDDVAAQAFAHLFRGIRQDSFSRLRDRDDLWQVLAMLVERRSNDHVRRVHRRREIGESELADRQDGKPRNSSLDRLAGVGPLPEAAFELVEHFVQMFERLPDETLRRIAEWKLHGWSNAEIAAQLGCTERTVVRKLRLIRKRWDA